LINSLQIAIFAFVAAASAGYAPAAVAPAAVSYSSNLAYHNAPLAYSRIAAVPNVAVNPLAYSQQYALNPYTASAYAAPISAYSALPYAAASPLAYSQQYALNPYAATAYSAPLAAPYGAYSAASPLAYSQQYASPVAVRSNLYRSAYVNGGLVY
jgi:hypothetical protein